MSLNIKINNRWSIESDSKSYTLVKHFKVKKKDGSVNGTLVPRQEIEGHYVHLNYLFEALTDVLVRDKDIKSLSELRAALDEIAKLTEDIYPKFL
jgi:hypothetical protein